MNTKKMPQAFPGDERGSTLNGLNCVHLQHSFYTNGLVSAVKYLSLIYQMRQLRMQQALKPTAYQANKVLAANSSTKRK